MYSTKDHLLHIKQQVIAVWHSAKLQRTRSMSNQIRKTEDDLNPKKQSYILFDEKCPMCNSFIAYLDKQFQKIGKADSPTIYGDADKLANTNSIKELIPGYKLSIIKKNAHNSIVYIKGDRFFLKSRAVAEILRDTQRKRCRSASLIIRLTPRIIADNIYTLIANNRILIGKMFPKVCSLGFKNLNYYG